MITVTCWFGITKASQIMVSVFLLRVKAGTILGEMCSRSLQECATAWHWSRLAWRSTEDGVVNAGTPCYKVLWLRSGPGAGINLGNWASATTGGYLR